MSAPEVSTAKKPRVASSEVGSQAAAAIIMESSWRPYKTQCDRCWCAGHSAQDFKEAAAVPKPETSPLKGTLLVGLAVVAVWLAEVAGKGALAKASLYQGKQVTA